jgi:hypothetical protein
VSQLQKTKKDKDKAIRLVIQLIGKERVSAFLSQHAGAADILDRLLDAFSTSGIVGGNGSKGGGSQPPRVAMQSQANP